MQFQFQFQFFSLWCMSLFLCLFLSSSSLLHCMPALSLFSLPSSNTPSARPFCPFCLSVCLSCLSVYQFILSIPFLIPCTLLLVSLFLDTPTHTTTTLLLSFSTQYLLSSSCNQSPFPIHPRPRPNPIQPAFFLLSFTTTPAYLSNLPIYLPTHRSYYYYLTSPLPPRVRPLLPPQPTILRPAPVSSSPSQRRPSAKPNEAKSSQTSIDILFETAKQSRPRTVDCSSRSPDLLDSKAFSTI